MIFVDTNVLMYAVGRSHPLKEKARAFFEEALASNEPLTTSAEVLQELLHAYLPVGRIETLDAALSLAESSISSVWPVELEDILLARLLHDRHATLGARDLLHRWGANSAATGTAGTGRALTGGTERVRAPWRSLRIGGRYWEGRLTTCRVKASA